MAIILGIDPGSRKMGFGVINQVGVKQEYIASGCIRLEKLPTFPERLDSIFVHVSQVIEKYLPQELAIEEVFMGQNAQSALKLGQARGCAIVAATQAKLPVYEYAARKVKQAIVGNGNADKTQMGLMVKQLLKLPGIPQEDAADALAIAMCHGHSRGQLLQLDGVRYGRKGRMSLQK